MKYTSLLIVLGAVALFVSVKLLKYVRVRPSLGPVSEQWLFDQRRHSDDQ